MSSNHLKTPFNKSLTGFAEKKAADALQLVGKSLPASVTAVISAGIVRVKFEVNAAPYTLPEVEVPVEWSEFIRVPVYIGMTGRVNSADALLGGVSGLGSGTASLAQPGNLTALSFTPLGSVSWTPSDDPNATVIYGPDGVIIRTADSANKVTISSSGTEITGNIGFYGHAPAAKPAITGALNAVTDVNARTVMRSIIAALVAVGLVTNSTT